MALLLCFMYKQDIYRGDLEVLDSNPPGKYDEEAISALLRLLPSKNPLKYATWPTARSALLECSTQNGEGRGSVSRSFPGRTDSDLLSVQNPLLAKYQ